MEDVDMAGADTAGSNAAGPSTAARSGHDLGQYEQTRLPLHAEYKHDVQALFSLLSSSDERDEDEDEEIKVLRKEVERILTSTVAGKKVWVAEGRANVVFRYVPFTNEPDQTEDQEGQSPLAGMLLRVPKLNPEAKPHSYERLQQYREQVVEPAVGARFLVPQLLVELPEHEFRNMNMERFKRQRRDPSGQLSPPHAMLIQDLHPLPWCQQIGLEFKPKWLAQSPIAPADATRCRTCAREAYRNSEKLKEGKAFTAPVCPLGLVSNVDTVVRRTIGQLAPGWSEADQLRLKEAFDRTKILTKLRDLQVKGDPGNTMFENPRSEAFGLAMTLRDCTCFVRMSRDPSDPTVEIKLADVDEKNWESKKEYWQKSHNTFLENGFYHGNEEPRIETRCALKWWDA
ncbi:inositol-pentakisphosphate 2-kinase-domain-containing protein [Xylariales sp. AK1849]|nr:inositol-pentakisphosphate 2-kinase-domain-containing protein [Xylariales sp. AK1849]